MARKLQMEDILDQIATERTVTVEFQEQPHEVDSITGMLLWYTTNQQWVVKNWMFGNDNVMDIRFEAINGRVSITIAVNGYTTLAPWEAQYAHI